ncbi:MAG: alpha/beta hydrolase [Nitrospiraceae bacterium]|nr:alpha/beta hydrolase [Nitrospiraceae bacterium]
MPNLDPDQQRTQTPLRSVLRFSFVLFLLLTVGCESVFFYPSRGLFANPFLKEFPPQDVAFRSSDGVTLLGWFFAAKDPVGTILILHGNAENISTHVNGFLWLIPNGFNLFIFDYRGYGLSEGDPSLAGIQRDAEAALEKLMTLPGVDPDRIVVYGQSLGGTVAVNLVASSPHKKRIRALVVDSAFASHRLIAQEKMSLHWFTWPLQYPVSWFFASQYSPVRHIADVAPVPVLIIHGMHDTIVPVRHSELLFDAAREPKELWFTANQGHIRSIMDPPVRAKLKEYLIEKINNTIPVSQN